jgi:SAM-dependent methyltransferase
MVHEDVVYGTPPDGVAAFVECFPLSSEDVLVDIGSGDGRVLIAAAARYRCLGIGIEKESRLVTMARNARARAGLRKNQVTFVCGDGLVHAPLYRGAKIVYLYQYWHLTQKLLPLIPPDVMVVSYELPFRGWRQRRVVWGQHTFYVLDPR